MANNKKIVVVKTNKKRKQEVDVVVTRRQRRPAVGGYMLSRPLSAPQGAGSITGSSRPNIRTLGDEVICVRNTEIFNSINGSVTPSLAMNQACIPGSFTWLAALALNFGKWRWKSLRLIYIPNCPTTTAGALTLGIYYDTNDATPTSRQILSAARDSVSIPPWGGWEGSQLLNREHTALSREPGGTAALNFDTTKCQKPWYPYITSGNYAALTPIDRNIYSPGVAYGVSDGGVVTAWGTIYASYEVELIEPMSGVSNN